MLVLSRAHLALPQGEHLGAVGEGDRSRAESVEDGKDEDEEGDGADAGRLVLRGDEEAESCGEEGPEHLREHGQVEPAAAHSVDGVVGAKAEDPAQGAKANGDVESLELSEASLDEDGSRVEGDAAFKDGGRCQS